MKPKRPTASSLDHGLVAWLENTRIALPLKGVECRFEVTGAIACVELDQIYFQSAARPLDCTYTFPLPAGAAVYRCELHVNDRVIQAKVEEKAKARQIYLQQKAAGRRAALVEVERENLFTLSLGNVQPGDLIVVRFAWFQVLDRAGDGRRLLIPTCPGVRYIPGQPLLRGPSGRGTADDTDQVPDASRITPPRIDALHPDAAYFSLEGRLASADVASGTVSSPSHAMIVREKGDAVTVALSNRRAIPDRDLILAWQEPKATQLAPQAWRWTEGDDTYALVQLRAPENAPLAEHLSQDFYFLVDRSGSMDGQKWQRTCEAVRAFVELLGDEDRVWITLFESDLRDFAEAPWPAPAVLADRGFQNMAALGTAGGTELEPAATHVLRQISRHSKKRPANVVLITDGQVGNEDAILRAFGKVPAVRVHTFGIDTAVNDAFLKTLARQQRGGCWLQTPNDDIAGTIAALGDRLRRPVLTGLSINGSWEAGAERWPDLHAGEIVCVSLRGARGAAVEISGRLPDGSKHRFAVPLAAAGSPAIRLFWARERIAALLESDRHAEALTLAKRHNLICEGAAFIAWDGAEQVPVAVEEIVQPAMEPQHARMLMKCRPAPHCAPPSQALDGFLLREEITAYRRPSAATSGDRYAELATGLREAGRQAGIPEALVDDWAAWAGRRQSDAGSRFSALREAAELIAEISHGLEAPVLRHCFERQIGQVLHEAPSALLSWAQKTRPVLHRLRTLHQRLLAADTPEEMLRRLDAWMTESGEVDHARVESLEALAESLDHLPFSAGSKIRLWRSFLQTTVRWNADDTAAALRWLGDPMGSLDGAVVRVSD